MILAQLLALALSASDVCETPSFDPDVVGGEPFCIVEEVQEIETPYFKLTVSPRVLVWLYDEGRTLTIESSVHQSRISLGISVTDLEPEAVPTTMRAHGCPDVELRAGVKTLCDRTDGDYVSRTYAILKGARLIVIGLSASPLAKEELANYESILNSIESTL
jgi:hypothetical protein